MNSLSCSVGKVQRVLSLPQRNYLTGFVGGCCKLGFGLVMPELLPLMFFGRKRGEEYAWRSPSFLESRDYAVDFDVEAASSVLITGASGSGKSTFAKRLVYGITVAGGAVCVCDVHNEYFSVVRACGGRVIDTKSVSLSLFELDSCSPSEKAFDISALLRRTLGLGEVQAHYLLKSIREAYAARHIIEGDKSTWQLRPPSLSDVVVACDKLIASSKRVDASLLSLKRRLESLASSGVFSSKTHIPFSVIVSQTTCFELQNLRSNDAISLFVEVFLRKLYSFMQARKVSGRVFALVDEAQTVCVSSGEEPSYVGALARTARKFSLGLIVVSQNLSSLDPAITGNCSSNFVFLSREPDDSAYAVSLLSGGKYSPKARLVEEELSSLRQFECLASTSAQRDVARVRVTPLWEEGVKEVEEKELPFIAGSNKQRFFSRSCSGCCRARKWFTAIERLFLLSRLTLRCRSVSWRLSTMVFSIILRKNRRSVMSRKKNCWRKRAGGCCALLTTA